MTILAISTSSNTCSVCLLENDKVIKEMHTDGSRSHSEKLMPLIKELLDSSNVSLSDISLIASDNGPRVIYRY